MPSLAEILTFGPKAWVREQERAEQQGRIDAITEQLTEQRRRADAQRVLSAAEPVGGGPFTAQTAAKLGAPTQFSDLDAPALSSQLDVGLSRAGLDLRPSTQARLDTQSFNRLDEIARQIQEQGFLGPGQAAAANILNKRAVEPVNLSGGVAFSPFAKPGTNPILAESSAVRAQAQERMAGARREAATEALRRAQTSGKVQDTFNQANEPLKFEDIMVDGQLVKAGVYLNLDGTTSIRPIQADDGGLVFDYRSPTSEFKKEDSPISLWRKAMEEARDTKAELQKAAIPSQRAMGNQMNVNIEAARIFQGAAPNLAPLLTDSGQINPQATWFETDTRKVYQGQLYEVGQIIEAPLGPYRVIGFAENGEPEVEPAR